MTRGTHSLYKEMLVDAKEVNLRIDQLADDVIKRYKGQDPLFVCLLRGGAPFASKLMFAITAKDPYFCPEMDYMTIKAYGSERTDKPAELIMDLAPTTRTAGRVVVLLDDVLDKGITAEYARDLLTGQHGASRVDCVVLVQKARSREHYGDATLYGFEAPADWLTGMGLDDTRIAEEANRWANFIAIANPET